MKRTRNSRANPERNSTFPDTIDGSGASMEVPDHLRRWPGLFVRDGDKIVEAPPEDQRLAQRYPSWPEKGPVIEGRRVTIMVARQAVEVGEEVRLIHVLEVVEPGQELAVMGPKAIHGEFVDSQLATPEPDPALPKVYSGAVIPSPAVDYNFDITVYSFSVAGKHSIQWKPGPLVSNIIEMEVLT